MADSCPIVALVIPSPSTEIASRMWATASRELQHPVSNIIIPVMQDSKVQETLRIRPTNGHQSNNVKYPSRTQDSWSKRQGNIPSKEDDLDIEIELSINSEPETESETGCSPKGMHSSFTRIATEDVIRGKSATTPKTNLH
jgi:hypothetical protein